MIMSVWKHLVHKLGPCKVFYKVVNTHRIVCDVAYLSGVKKSVLVCQALNADFSNVLRRIKLQTCVFVLALCCFYTVKKDHENAD